MLSVKSSYHIVTTRLKIISKSISYDVVVIEWE